MTHITRAALRRSILRHLYTQRSTSPHPVSAIHINLRESREVPDRFDEDDVAQELAMLEGLGLVSAEIDPIGSMRSWKLTGQGTLFYERNIA